MSNSLQINTSTIVPVPTIRTIRPITDDERARMSEKYGKPVEDFADKRTTIQFNDKSSKTTDLSLDQVREQGVALVDIGGQRFVPAANIKSAEDFTADDAAKLKDSGRVTLTQEFKSRVITTGGSLLSTVAKEQIIDASTRALLSAGQGSRRPVAAATVTMAVATATPVAAAGKPAPKTPANG